jgi:putative transport protein
MMRADLRRDAKAFERQLSGGQDSGPLFSAAHYGLRAYRIESAEAATSNLAALQDRFAAERLSAHRVQRDGELLPLHPALALKLGDRVVVSARRAAFLRAERDIGPEIDDPSLLSVPIQTAAVVVTGGAANGKTLGALAQDEQMRGVYLESLQRCGQSLPFAPWTTVQRGDILRIIGAPENVQRAAARIGYVERDLSATDITFLVGGICTGILLGLLKLNAGGVLLGLGTSGSILVMGLAAGWARSRYPALGTIPEAAQRLLIDVGLIVFIAVIGLHAGPHAVEAYAKSGGSFFASILVAGMIVTTVPLAVGLIVARYWLGMSPLMTLGALAGAQTCMPGLNALREASGSNVVSLAYTVPYAIGNILLTVAGPAVVAIVHAMRTP